MNKDGGVRRRRVPAVGENANPRGPSDEATIEARNSTCPVQARTDRRDLKYLPIFSASRGVT